MKRAKRVFLVLLCLLWTCSFSSCVDMGEGDSETAFYDYFSAVYLLSDGGLKKVKIKKFHEEITMESSDLPDEVVKHESYAYIAFRVAKGYTLTVEDFAFFAKTEAGQGEHNLDLEFYTSPVLPSKIITETGESAYLPQDEDGTMEDTLGEEDGAQDAGGKHADNVETDDEGNPKDREGEVDESIFNAVPYATAVFHVTEAWDSTHLEFSQAQQVKAGEYIIVRILNNVTRLDENGVPILQQKVKFTFNNLMFRFTNVKKD